MFDELIVLEGSPKQIKWAEDIRAAHVAMFKKMLEAQPDEEKVKIAAEEMMLVTEAASFIDRRHLKGEALVKEYYQLHLLKERAEFQRKVLDEVVYKPDGEDAIEGAERVEIRVLSNCVAIKSPKHRSLIEEFKLMEFGWYGEERLWKGYVEQPEVEKLAAIMTALVLREGFPVVLNNKQAREHFEARDFEIARRLIGYNDAYENFSVRLIRCSEIAEHLNAIPHKRIDRNRFAIEPKYIDDLEEFAEEFNFEWTPRAAQVLRSLPRRAVVHVNTDDLSDLFEED